MSKHRSYPIEFKRQVAQEHLAGEAFHGLAKRHEISPYCLTEECYRSRRSACADGSSRFAGGGGTEGGRSPTAVLPPPASDFWTSPTPVVVAATIRSAALLRSAFRSRCTIECCFGPN